MEDSNMVLQALEEGEDDDDKEKQRQGSVSETYSPHISWGEAAQFEVLMSEETSKLEVGQDKLQQAPQDENPPRPLLQGDASQLEILLSENPVENPVERAGLLYHRDTVKMPKRSGFWDRVDSGYNSKKDPLHEYLENTDGMLEIPTLWECKRQLHNGIADEERFESKRVWTIFLEAFYNYVAAILIYLSNTMGVESILVTLNTLGATSFYCANEDRFAVKLDFAFLSVAVVFPLTFLISSTFARREQALVRLADFKSCLLSTVLFTLTVDWPDENGNRTGGRLELPESFNTNTAKDYCEIVQLMYEYLSMPNIANTRNVLMWARQTRVKRVRAIQNDIVKKLHAIDFDLSMHTEVMRSFGFQAGEASRLHQYHQYLLLRIEHLRVLKYYRTPLSTRSFGRAYIIILPWIMGPYFAWVFDHTNWAFTLILSCFTSLILLGLLNTQLTLEDPFVDVPGSWTPGIDDVKLDLEMASTIQTIMQFKAQAELHRLSALNQTKEKDN